MDEYKYQVECSGCECKVILIVQDEDEFPCFCPMCGQDIADEWKQIEE